MSAHLVRLEIASLIEGEPLPTMDGSKDQRSCSLSCHVHSARYLSSNVRHMPFFWSVLLHPCSLNGLNILSVVDLMGFPFVILRLFLSGS